MSERDNGTPPPQLQMRVADAFELVAKLIEDHCIMDTSAGKVLAPRQEGNRDGLHYAVAIRALAADVTNHGSKGDLHPEYVTNPDGTKSGYKGDSYPGNVPPRGDA